jgi:hypothetical protein
MIMKTLSIRRAATVGAIAVFAALTTMSPGSAFAAAVNTGYFGNVAIEGYDTVAYFTDGKAIEGSPAISHVWKGAIWRFASEEHRKLFAANPDAYAPQFGGLCTEGVAFHEVTVNLEPESWRIVDGKLYMTAATGFADLEGNLSAAVANWPEVQAKLAE